MPVINWLILLVRSPAAVEDTPSLLASLAKTVGEVTITQTAAQTGKAFVESAAEVGRQLGNRRTS